MRIGIDARFYGPVGKGLGRYTQKLIENLEKIDEVNEYFIFLRAVNFDDYQPKNKNFKKVLADFGWYTFSEQIKFPKLLKNYKLDLVHFAHFNVPLFYFGKFVVTIHDLILLHFPTTRSSTLSPIFYWLKYMAYKLTIKSAILRSGRIIAVSRFTKKDILKNYPRIPQEKIVVTHEACDDYCLYNPKKPEEILDRYGIIKPYILYIGNVYPHKNPERLIAAMKGLEKEIPQLKLIFVGGEDFFYRRLKNMVKAEKIGNVTFVGFVPDYDLDTIFRSSRAYVRPSLHEGFELPGLEAMSRGTPVLASDYECSREILGDAAHYFDGHSVESIQEAIRKIFYDDDFCQKLSQKGIKQAAKYSWKKTAWETLEVYRKIKK